MSKFDAILSTKPVQHVAKRERTAQSTANEPKTPTSKRVGKRSHPDYAQITAYVLKDTHEQVMRKIYKRQEFSELIEQLLTDWLKNAE